MSTGPVNLGSSLLTTLTCLFSCAATFDSKGNLPSRLPASFFIKKTPACTDKSGNFRYPIGKYFPGRRRMTYKRLRIRYLSGTILVLSLLVSAQPRDIFAQDVGETSSPTDGSRDAEVDPSSSDSLSEQLKPQSGTQTENT